MSEPIKPNPAYPNSLGGRHHNSCRCDKCKAETEANKRAAEDLIQRHRESVAETAFLAPEHAEMIEMLKNQLLIVFLKRLGGSVDVPVAEVDDTEGQNLMFSLKGTTFHFEIEEKTNA